MPLKSKVQVLKKDEMKIGLVGCKISKRQGGYMEGFWMGKNRKKL